MTDPVPALGKAQRTRVHIFRTALALFDAHGYDAVSVARIAEAAGVSEMTVYRHFPTKDAILLDDPYDPVIVAASAAPPVGMPPLRRAVADRAAAERPPGPRRAGAGASRSASTAQPYQRGDPRPFITVRERSAGRLPGRSRPADRIGRTQRSVLHKVMR